MLRPFEAQRSAHRGRSGASRPRLGEHAPRVGADRAPRLAGSGVSAATRSPATQRRGTSGRQAAGAGTVIGTAIGGPAGAITGASIGVLLVPLAEKVWAEVTADGRRRGAEVLAFACQASGRPVEQILELTPALKPGRLR